VHTRWELQPGFRDRQGKYHRPIVYVDDFYYYEGDRSVVEDVKGPVTRVYAIKRKLFQFRYPEVLFRETLV